MAGQSLSNYTVQHAHFVDEEIGPQKAGSLPKIIQPSSGRVSPGIWISHILPEDSVYTKLLGRSVCLSLYAMNMEEQISLKDIDLMSLDIYPEVGLLDYIVILFLVF